jgi:hypothetical protein
MDLEEQEGTETVGERCEVCGAKLSADELATALETGGPALCSVHALEAEALPEDETEA